MTRRLEVLESKKEIPPPREAHSLPRAIYAWRAGLLNRYWSNLFQLVFLIVGATAWMIMAMSGSRAQRASRQEAVVGRVRRLFF